MTSPPILPNNVRGYPLKVRAIFLDAVQQQWQLFVGDFIIFYYNTFSAETGER
jgi:hypothetical protein